MSAFSSAFEVKSPEKAMRMANSRLDHIHRRITMSEADRYVENCALFTTEPIAAFETALRMGASSCSLAGVGVDDNGMVGN